MGSETRFRAGILLTLVGILLIFFSRAEAASIGQPAPELTNTVWINSTPLQLADLRGKVILLEFWTYGPVGSQRVPAPHSTCLRFGTPPRRRDHFLSCIGTVS